MLTHIWYVLDLVYPQFIIFWLDVEFKIANLVYRQNYTVNFVIILCFIELVVQYIIGELPKLQNCKGICHNQVYTKRYQHMFDLVFIFLGIF